MKKMFLLIIVLLIPVNINALTYPELNSKKGIVYDLTDNKILYEKDSESIASIASLTKIMTTITALESIEDLDEVVTITSDMLNQVRWDASIAGLKVGDKVTYEDLLYASILPSGADATISIAVSTSGSVKNFTNKMNEKAKELGLENTHYVNVTGLDEDNHYSTVKDVLTLLKYALNNPKFKEIYTTKSYMLSNNLVVYSTISTYNKAMKLDTSRILGSKTGFTQDAGLCMSALINSDGHEILIILLNAEREGTISHNLMDTLRLVEFIDNNYDEITLLEENEKFYTIDVLDSKQEVYELKAKEEIKAFLPVDYDHNIFKIEYNGLDTLSYKNKIGEELGTVSYYIDGELIKTDKILLEEKIEFDFIKYIKSHIKIVLFVSIIMLVLVIGVIILNISGKKRLRRE